MKISFRLKYLILARLIISLLIIFQLKLLNYGGQEAYQSNSYFLGYFLIQFVTGVLLIIAFMIPVFDFIRRIESKWLQMILFFLHAILFGLIYTLKFVLVIGLYDIKSSSTDLLNSFKIMLFTNFHNAIRTYLVYITILFAYDYFQKSIKAIVKVKNFENKLNKIKLDALHIKLQPHFLFNTFNNVVALIDENKTSAQNLIIRLSDLLRSNLNLEPDKLISIEEEIGLVENYLAIEKYKYEEKLEVSWELNKNLNGMMVPPLILQPLVENSIIHGFERNESHLKIVIRTQEQKIEVLNNGRGIGAEFSKGRGLMIVEELLNIHFRGNYKFRIYQEKEWVINEITLK